MNHILRMQKLAALAHDAGHAAVLVTHPSNVRYLCGFTGSAGVLLAAPRAFFFTDGRYAEQAQGQVHGAKVIVCRKPLLHAAAEAMRSQHLPNVAVETSAMTVDAYCALAEALGGCVELRESEGIVERLRLLKDGEEVASIRRAVRLASGLLSPLVRSLRPGATESEVAARLEFNARKAGVEGMSFETIIAGGERSSMPHAVASATPLPQKGFVVMDYGVRLDGYCSDMTRTVHLGRANAEERSTYAAVLEAQMAAVAVVRPGVTVGDVDSAARRVLRRSKLAKFFTHAIGHGVGLEIHEAPRVAAKGMLKLEPGMIITIEPGVYLPGRFGIRIEDMLAVTEQGAELLTPSSKELMEI